jgi:hypothetical protein
MRRRYLFGSFVGLLFALLPSTALAATYTESTVAGVETGVPTACSPPVSGDSLSSFAGVAFGSVNGTFNASVCHTSLSATTPAKIVGGVFTLTNGSTTASGGFTGGSVTFEGAHFLGGLCVQKFGVAGTLTRGGNFTATLTHYGFGGACTVFFATVAGSATVITL